jgi:hypothetical protein
MTFRPSEFINKTRDEKREQDCSKYLRELDDVEHAAFLWEILSSKDNSTQLTGCRLVERSMPNHAFIINMLEYALTNCDVSSIGFWINAVLKNLGPNKTVMELSNRVDKHREMIDAACYHISQYFQGDTNASKLFRELKNDL